MGWRGKASLNLIKITELSGVGAQDGGSVWVHGVVGGGKGLIESHGVAGGGKGVIEFH